MRVLVFLLFVSFSAAAQNSHPMYWKSRPPRAGYWQQDVHYNIAARLDEERHTIVAHQQLAYTNNSPDTLRFVFFHLFQNAFVEGSYLDKLQVEKKMVVKKGPYEQLGLGTTITNLQVNEKPVRSEIDNTIMKVYLPEPLLPGGTAQLTLDFTTYFDDGGTTRRRMKMYDAWGSKHYNGCQWFPKLAVYDAKFGWDTYQHFGKEFYGDFGTWDIALDLPSNYVVEATGALQNREEVLPEVLRKQLDMANFKTKKWDEAPSIITPYVKGQRKTWRYKAEQVHDFAWTADPSYRIATTYWKGIECVGIAQEPHAAGWQNSAAYVAKIIQTLSEDFGMYEYPKMVAADAADGMEYPMLTLDGGADPGYRGLLVHEIAHNWFYGMLGSNETYRAAMDEGFTQFATAWGLKRIEGESPLAGKPGPFFTRKVEPTTTMDARVMTPYILDALRQDEMPLNTHSDDFHNALGHENGYRQVYYKTATMLYNLQYTLGDSLFLQTMRNYVAQWKGAHPYFEDFKASVIGFTHMDLNWFFDEWFETTKTIDYSITGAKKVKGTDSFDVKLRRRGASQMPIRLTAFNKQGGSETYFIPNTWDVPAGTQNVLPKWFGWGQIQPRYTARVSAPGGLKEVVIDTSYRLADIYAPDNSFRPGLGLSRGVDVRFDWGRRLPLDRRRYRLALRPDVWYNAIDGVKAGIHLEGNYMQTLHQLEGTVWFNTHVAQWDEYHPFRSEGFYDKYLPISYTAQYVSPITRNYPKLQLVLQSRNLDGLQRHAGGLRWNVNDQNTLSVSAQTLFRSLNADFDYLLYPQEWQGRAARPNSSLNLDWNHRSSYRKGAGSYTLSLRAPFLAGNGPDAFNYGWAQAEAINRVAAGKLDLRTRLFARLGMGGNIPWESGLYLAGASPEELMDNKFLRAKGIAPTDWTGYSATTTNHLQQGGGLNLRGYAGYLVAQENGGKILLGYKGRSGVGGSAELDFDRLFKFTPKATRNWLHLDVYAFADAGSIQLSGYDSLNAYSNLQPTNVWSKVRADAGLGTALTIKKWGKFDKAKPLTIRFDVPAFLSHPPAGEEYFKFRYMVGIGRSF